MTRILYAVVFCFLAFTSSAEAQPNLQSYVYGSSFYVNAPTRDPSAWNCSVVYTLDYVQFGEPGSQTFNDTFYIPRRASGIVFHRATTWAASTLKLTNLQGPFCSEAGRRKPLLGSSNLAPRRGVLMFTTVGGAPPTAKWSTKVDAPVLPPEVDGKVKSIAVGEAPVYLFDQPNYGGQRLTIVRAGGCDNLAVCLPGAGDWSNRIRSIKFPSRKDAINGADVYVFPEQKSQSKSALVKSDIPEYHWYNGTSQNVRLKFTYLDGNLEPTGQTDTRGIPPGEWYETSFGLNTYAYMSVINGRAADWDPNNDIFGYGYKPSGNFHIVR